MKLQCQVGVVNRIHVAQNIIPAGKYLKSTLALGKEPKNENEHFILHFSSLNKTGVKYKVKSIKKAFVSCLNEGKVTLRFEEPPHDLCIKCEAIQLKCFMRLLKQCITGDTKDLKLASLANISVTAKDNAPTKLVIRERSEFPSSGLPRTLEHLSMSNLQLCNFRRDVLLLKHLTVLDLSNNWIERIPTEFGRMPNITELYLANNLIGIKGEIDWEWLLGPQLTKTLKLLDLSGCKLSNLPKAIWKLQKLVTLKLENNYLENLPSTIGRITSLRYLSLARNRLQALPCSVMQCKLEFIDLSSNNFNRSVAWSRQNNPTPFEFFVGDLVHLAAKVVLNQKLYYAPNLIPWTLADFLDNANMCVCGAPVLNQVFFISKRFELKDFFRTAVFDHNSSVNFECYFCSLLCFKVVKCKWMVTEMG